MGWINLAQIGTNGGILWTLMKLATIKRGEFLDQLSDCQLLR